MCQLALASKEKKKAFVNENDGIKSMNVKT